ncbi:nonsense-mediated mRNA decay factor SMG9 isoform X1 [Synchiropus splendidus]|uniref:nonsense-mediated mRNA decay factor SMG9 isoform X1 n=1 Tax=Synchiropus splendidus TaxID=270530 RepID=UPI00237EC2E2|nr:nonsense-mediated mRNA decay factor SMG9 isoform X1 [Synchiropus splendidus]
MSESGHSQPGMYGPGRRRRRRRGERDIIGPPGQNLSGPSRERDYQPRERRDGSEDPPGPLIQKTPIILAKPPGERAKTSQSTPASGVPVIEKPIMLMKARDDGTKPGTPPETAAQPSGPSKIEREGQRPTQPVYQIQNRGMGSSASSSTVDPMVGQAKLVPAEKMKHSIKLVDDQMNWCDSAMEYLRHQTDMLVVGVIGLQGTGKSTVMSLLSANTPEEDQRGYVFRAQTQEIKERAGNQSTGIDFFITQERVIFLDTQPILSPSSLDHLINNDRKLPPEYNLPSTYVEMQSLQIAAFLFTVCHVVIVVQDWFTDLNLYRFLQTAEMLKPSTPSASSDSSGSSGNDDGAEYYPHIVFLQNKTRREDFCPRNFKNMHVVVDKLMSHSHLKYKGLLRHVADDGFLLSQCYITISFSPGSLSMLDCNIFPGLGQDFLPTEVNMFLLPVQESDGEDQLNKAGSGTYPLFSLLPGYRGHPSFSTMVFKLRSQILAMPRCQLSHTILTEKNWFHYAARIWDGVKKSSALSEYSRLLC